MKLLDPRLLIALIALVLALQPAESQAQPTTLVIGSKTFTESRLLGEIMAQLIEAHTDIPVERRHNLGGSILIFTALVEGEIHLYPEYTGTLWYGSDILNISSPPRSALHAYAFSRQELVRRWNLHLLMPFGFNNTYAMAVRSQMAEQLNLQSISDLAGHIGGLKVAVSHEFLQRPDGWPRLAETYGLQDANPRGIEHGLIYRALTTGEADLVDSYSTDGKLLDYPVQLLKDDREFFPPYQGVPLISGHALKIWPELEPLLSQLGFRLDDAQMRQLNQDAERDANFARVASAFLEAEGLIQTADNGELTPTASRSALPWPQIWAEIGWHLYLSLVSLLIACLIALPLGVLLARHPRAADPVIWATGMLQTIPALALFALLITLPGFGLGPLSAITAISLYAVLPTLRNAYTSIREVDIGLTDTARALGLTDRQILFEVELPLAAPTMMAGVRTSAVIAVGMATLAAFVGAGGLGDFILTGLQLVNTPLILAGALPAAGLALLTDLLLGAVEHWLRPRGLRA